MELRFAKIISFIFHPLLMPTYGFTLLFYTKNYMATFTDDKVKLLVLGITFLFTFLLPLLNALILLKLGRISSLEMENPQERVIPYGSTSLYYFALYYLFYNVDFPDVFKIVILGAGISILITLFINFRWKISAHNVGVGGLVGAMLGIIYRLQLDLELVLIALLLVAGLVGYARLRLKAHSPAQVYTGFLLGFAIEMGLMFFY